MDGTADNEIEIRVVVKDAAAAIAQIKAVQDAARAAAGGDAGHRVEIPVHVDAAQLHDEVKEAAAAASGDAVEMKVGVDGEHLRGEIHALVADADADGRVEIPVHVEVGDAPEKLARVAAAAEEAEAAGNGLTQAAAGRWRNSLRQFATDAEKAAAGVEDVGRKASGAGSSANGAGGSFAFLHSRVFMLGGAALALGPALAAIPAALGGAALGAGVMAMAFGGVVGALKDYAAQSGASSSAGSSSAATAFSNAVAIRGAQQAISDARRQAAISDQNSADSVVAAEQRLASAQQTLTRSQESLTLAERDGVNVLKDLNLAARDSANSVVDAQLAVEQAEENARKARGNSLLTDLQKRQAAQQLVDAQQQLTDAQQRNTEAQQAADDANAKGVEGSNAVVAAKRSEASAAQGVMDAQHAMVVAQRNAAEQQRASAEQVTRAVQALADMQRQQALAAQSGGGAANRFARDMANASPPVRDMVNQILSMRGGFDQLKLTAQTATLPGFTQMLKDSTTLFPVVNGGIGQMGTAIGGTARQFGELMKSPAFRGELKQVMSDAAGLATQLGSGMVRMVGGIAQAAARAGPIVKGIGGGLQVIMSSGVPAFFQGLVGQAGDAGKLFSGLGGIISELLGPVGALSGALAGALGPFVQQLATALLPVMPQLTQAFKSVADVLAAVLRVVAPLLPMLATILVGALRVLNPLLQGMAQFLQENHRWLTPLAGILLAVWGAVKAWAIAQAALNLVMDANLIGLLVLAIAGLVVGVVYCWENFQGFRDFIKRMWADIKIWFFDAWHAVNGVWQGLVRDAKSVLSWFGGLPGMFAGWLASAATAVGKGAGDVLKFFSDLPGKILAALANIGKWLYNAGRDLIGGLIDGVESMTTSVTGAVADSVAAVLGVVTHTKGHAAPKAHASGGPLTFAASGGILSGLSAIIGERGVEMMRLPDGTTVMPHANTASALAQGGSGGGAQRLQIEWVGGNGGDEFLTWLRRNIRIRGGSGGDSVQKVLGQSF